MVGQEESKDVYLGAQLPSASAHIRLLHISPSGQNEGGPHRDAPLVCSFSVTEIASPTPYKALSYTWGDVARPWPCWANFDGIQLPITHSLDLAIRALRHETEMTTLWIDQLCINQADDAERSDQILLMEQVYSKADEVLAWLGPAADDSDAVMNAFLTVGDGAMDLDMSSYYTVERLPILMGMMHVDTPDPADETAVRFRALQDSACRIYRPILRAINSWCRRAYFTRIWVVQEFALGPEMTFLCGTKRVSRQHVLLATQVLKNSGSRFEDFLSIYKDIEALIDEPTGAFFGAWRRRAKFNLGTGKGDELFQLLRSLHVENRMLASDGRDRVYGLLGLAVDTASLGVKPDYVNSTFASVMTETARAIAMTGRVELLSYSQYPKNDPDLPSWVPDWRPTLRPSYYTIYENAQGHLFSTSGSTAPAILPTTDPLVLGLEGFTVDTIEQLGSPWWDEGWNHSRYLAFLTQVSLLCQLSAAKNQPIYASAARREEAVWRVPVADLVQYGGDGRAPAEAKSSYDACLELCELFEEWKLMKAGEWETSGGEKLKQLMEVAGNYRASLSGANSMRPFLTERGYLGLAPTVAAKGDVVVVFKGARIPYVVRPVDKVRHFRFIGEAYCDGIMDGEVVEKGIAEEFYLV
ncbi:related to HET-6OR heterokaryon incompatibility protein (het-6OR allele) [Cephalotrichum gorgonifer]|uniref:Related to HET-6OR heterokaryon incompatibility protein (Het-6OR allele) n=1 Tax=Cephalotrichum gorgonifer TaxID=2041049 RepID=A0AAE8MXI6_9PEZI|nr:related to HET-6OR heterokaryon incompatibility protein (het-6OR allele) [Cephalotrichum gorgonifer]